MGFIVLPASIPDIREIYDVYFEAFDGELVTQVLFPWDIHNEEFRAGHAKHTLEYWHKDSVQHTYKCIDTETGQIVGMSLWDFHWKELAPNERKLPSVDWLQEKQKERAQRFIQSFWARKEELIGGRPHVYCHVVAVRPRHQQQGIGALLMQPGMEIAEQLRVPLYLEATNRATKLYHKLGFEKLEKGVLLEPDVVGAEKPLEAPVMVKIPSTSSAENFVGWLKLQA